MYLSYKSPNGVLFDSDIFSLVKDVENQLKIESSDLIFENMTAWDLQTAAEMGWRWREFQNTLKFLLQRYLLGNIPFLSNIYISIFQSSPHFNFNLVFFVASHHPV